MTAERLLIELRTLNIRVRVDSDLVRCKPPEGVSIPSDLADQIRTLKPQLLALLREEEADIRWRVESGLLLEAPITQLAGACAFCGARMPDQQTGNCVSCCLASARLVSQRWEQDQTTYPSSAVVASHYRQTETVRDMSSNRAEAA